MTNDTQTKPTRAALERAIHARHMDRIRAICARQFNGNAEQQALARQAACRESERVAARELHLLSFGE